MSSSNNITAVFNQFAGKILLNPERITFDIDTNLAQMETVAKTNGVQLRVMYPNKMYTMDYRMDRVNAQVTANPNGTYTVAGFTIG